MTELGNRDLINRIMKIYVDDNEKLITSLLELIYFFRGALSYEEALMMSPTERDLASRFINKRLESASKMMHPVF